jgi:hypothetical protein
VAKKTMIETLSLQDLEKKGYKQRQGNHNAWYLGNSKWPTHEIRHGQEALLGRSFEIRDIKGDRVMVIGHDGEEYYIPMHLIKTKIPKRKTMKTIFRDEVVRYHGYGFKFPCSMSNMGREEAVELAKWILKVAK